MNVVIVVIAAIEIEEDINFLVLNKLIFSYLHNLTPNQLKLYPKYVEFVTNSAYVILKDYALLNLTDHRKVPPFRQISFHVFTLSILYRTFP